MGCTTSQFVTRLPKLFYLRPHSSWLVVMSTMQLELLRKGSLYHIIFAHKQDENCLLTIFFSLITSGDQKLVSSKNVSDLKIILQNQLQCFDFFSFYFRKHSFFAFFLWIPLPPLSCQKCENSEKPGNPRGTLFDSLFKQISPYFDLLGT